MKLAMRMLLTTLALFCSIVSAQAQTFPLNDTNEKLISSRAVEAVIWGMPAVNADLMLQQMLTKTSGKMNQFIYWGRPLDYHNQTLTPNPDTIYFMAFYDTKKVGALVLEIPPADGKNSLNANLVTFWQAAIEDLGLLGVDKGKGGKFVILPPDYKDKLPAGYAPLKSDTYRGFLLMRVNLASHADQDVAAAIAYGKRARFYPLSEASNPSATIFTDVKDIDYDSTIPYDLNFFDSLNRVVQNDIWIERDRAMIDQLQSIGIEKGKPFAPNEKMKTLLTNAIGEAKDLLQKRYEAGFPPFWEKGYWMFPTIAEGVEGQSTNYANHNKYTVDARGLAYTYAYISIKHLGEGQFYLMATRDKTGNFFDGSKVYKLHIPANVPVNQYWSVTAYDRQTHALIKNMPVASRSSQLREIQKNADGSIDIYIGPKAPAGKKSNWLPTDPKRGFELMFRLYGPKKEFFDKIWVLPDVEQYNTSN